MRWIYLAVIILFAAATISAETGIAFSAKDGNRRYPMGIPLIG